MNIPAVQPGCCAVCRLAEHGIGYFPKPDRHKPIKPSEITWTCDADLKFAKVVHHMPKEILNRIEEEALRAGGDAAGAYLEKIGKTDLAQLSQEEWLTFLATFEEGRGRAMREKLEAHDAPF